MEGGEKEQHKIFSLYFFYFFFHGIHAPFKEIPEQFNELAGDFPRVFSNLQVGFKLALADSDDH